MKLFAKSKTIGLLIGLVILAMMLPGVAAASTAFSQDAQYISDTIPASMTAGQSYTVSVTMRNTGSTTWDEASMIRLGGVGDATGDAVKFGPTRIKIPAGTSVAPGLQYTFTFTMTAPARASNYLPQYRMVWDGHQWFGTPTPHSVQVTGVPVSTSPVNAQVVSSTIPASMTAGQSYAVSVTMRNTGSTTWDEASMIRLGGVGDATGDAVKFGPTRIRIPAGTSVTPGSTYTFTFTMKGPASAGTYSPQYQMVWDGHQWFGLSSSQSVQVAGVSGGTSGVSASTSPVDAQVVSSTIPAAMNGGQSYTVSVTMKNTGTVTWTEASMIRLGGVGDATGDAVEFGPTRIRVPAGTSVTPGSSYTFSFTMTGPASAGTYSPQYRMVWDGHQWFGPTASYTVQVTGVLVSSSATSSQSTSTVNAQLVSSTIPSSMNGGQSYSVSVTMKNTGTTSWTEAGMIRLGGVGDASGDAVKFGPTRIRIPAGTIVAPGSSYAFSFTMTGPKAAGTYSPQYKMVWDGHQWFGLTASQSVRVASPISSAPPVSTPVVPVPTTTPSPVITISAPSTVSSDGTYGAGGYTGAGPIGGGAGYSSILTSGTYTVTTLAELKSHMVGGSQPATAGQVIFIPSGTTITFPAGNTPAIPAGVTLASDRGYNGHAGAVLKKSASSGGWTDRMLDIGGNNVRVTGLQLEGEMFPSTSSPVVSESNYLEGIKNYGGYTGEIIDNNELRGWAYSAIEVKGVPTSGRPWIHNNYIHNNQARGEGYGIEVYGGDVLVEANIFDYNRHDITGTGVTGEKYEFRYNIIQGGCDNPIGGVHVDVHESLDSSSKAGNTFLIHHNTVIQGSGTNQQAFVHIRDIPTTGAYIYNNDIQTNWGSDSNYDGAQSVIYQSHSQTKSVSNWNLFATNNKWKGTVYATNSGIVWTQCGSGSTC